MLALLLAVALATGPSSATLRMVPVAASARGAVLFRTWRELNPTGAHTVQRVEVGWLAVDAKGLWREAPHAAVDPAAAGEAAAAERIARLRAELGAPLDLATPPASVRPLLAELGIGAGDAVDPAEGRGAATWAPARTCARRSCAAGTVQRTIGGLESDPGSGAPVRAEFFRAGVALFRNGVDGEGRAHGARFTLAPNVGEEPGEGLVDRGYDLTEVDGIAIPGARPGSRTIPVRVRAGGALSDAATPTRARALLAAAVADAGEEAVRLVKDGREARAPTCARYLDLVRRGFGPGTTLEIHEAGALLVRCGGLDLLSRMSPSRESWVGEPVFGAAPLAALPPCVGGMHASDHAHAAASRASEERVAWDRYEPAMKVAEASPARLVLRDADSETILEPLAWGDVDGDGREDVLVAATVHATHGTWARYGLYALTRRAGDPLLRVVAERAQRPGSEGCPTSSAQGAPGPRE